MRREWWLAAAATPVPCMAMSSPGDSDHTNESGGGERADLVAEIFHA